MIHGGIIKDYNFPKTGIDFSVNVNPSGFPEGVKDAVIKNLDCLYRYPDLNYRIVLKNVSEYLKADERNIILGNGSMEIIDMLIQMSERVIIDKPCFNEYERRAEVRNKEVLPLETDLKKGDMIILGNPNNPDGRMVEDREKIYKRVRKAHAFLVLDETFIEFTNREDESIEYFKNFDFQSVAVIRAATKFFALPGLRFGYGIVNENMRKRLLKLQNPWSLNALVEPVSEVIFKDSDYIKNSKILISNERDFLIKSFSDFKSFQMLPGASNFYLLKIIKGTARELFDFLLKRGILTRLFNEKDLEGEYLRLAIRNREDNLRLINALSEYEEDKNGII